MPDVSAILTCHGEDVLLGPTMNSFVAAISAAERRKLSVEPIIVMDGATPTTELMVEENSRKLFGGACQVIKTKHGDPGQTRNSGVAVAGGEFVTFLDGDDLWGENWITACYDFYGTLGIQVVLQSEINVVFGKSRTLWVHSNSLSPDFQLDDLLVQNYWDAMAFSKTEIYRKYPFDPIDLKTGYGHEDWHWSCETMAAGIHHVPVPGTVHFKRARKGSQMSLCDSADVVLRPNPLMTFKGLDAAKKKLKAERKKVDGSYLGRLGFTKLTESV